MKFPRTPHIPGSSGTDDDIHAEYTYPGTVIATEKMDGSNIMMNNKKFITRKGETSTAEWTYPIRNLHYQIMHLIPDGVWLAGEFVYWRKNTPYENLPGAYLVFGAVEDGTCLSWNQVKEIAEQCGLPLVNTIGEPGTADQVINNALNHMNGTQEGFVIRPADSFPLNEYKEHVGKWVKPDHNPVAGNNGTNGIVT